MRAAGVRPGEHQQVGMPDLVPRRILRRPVAVRPRHPGIGRASIGGAGRAERFGGDDDVLQVQQVGVCADATTSPVGSNRAPSGPASWRQRVSTARIPPPRNARAAIIPSRPSTGAPSSSVRSANTTSTDRGDSDRGDSDCGDSDCGDSDCGDSSGAVGALAASADLPGRWPRCRPTASAGIEGTGDVEECGAAPRGVARVVGSSIRAAQNGGGAAVGVRSTGPVRVAVMSHHLPPGGRKVRRAVSRTQPSQPGPVACAGGAHTVAGTAAATTCGVRRPRRGADEVDTATGLCCGCAGGRFRTSSGWPFWCDTRSSSSECVSPGPSTEGLLENGQAGRARLMGEVRHGRGDKLLAG
jgi:hypothetical protein